MGLGYEEDIHMNEPSDSKPIVLFVPLHPTSLHSMLGIARALVESGRGDPVVLITTSDLDKRTDSGLSDDRVRFIRLVKQKAKGDNNRPKKWATRLRDALRRLVVRVLPLDFRQDLKDMLVVLMETVASGPLSVRFERGFRRQIHRLMPIVRDLRPVSIVTPGDRHLGWEPAVLAVAERFSIPVVVPPISQPALPENLSLLRKRRMNRASWYTRRAWPEHVWFNYHSGRSVSYYRTSVARALHKIGVLSNNPKVIGGGQASLVLVDGQWTADNLSRWGVSERKLVITGKLEHDILYERYRNRTALASDVRKNYALVNDSLVVIAALPQLGEHFLLPWDQHWQIQHEICRTLTSHFDSVLVSLHPKMDPDQYSFLNTQYGVSILTERLDEVLPTADLFVVGQGSSTALWSVLCRIPTVVCDWYGLNLKAYDSFRSLKLTKTVDDFRQTIERLAHSEDYRRTLSAESVGEGVLISPFDGRANERILSAILQPDLHVKRTT